MSSTGAEPTASGSPATTQAITPYVAVSDARAALDWYAEALGAVVTDPPQVMPDGRVGHSAFTVAGATVMMSDAHPELGVVAPTSGAAAVTLHLEVPDVDALTRRAVAAGATLQREPSDNPYGRIAVIEDPFGHRWMLNTPPAGAAGEQPSDVAYLTLGVVDDERARAFFGAVLGWQTTPGRVDRGWQVTGVQPPRGIGGGAAAPQVIPMFRVDDIAAAVERVRAAGGTATEPERAPYGLVSNCTDDQGMRFDLGEV